MVDELHGINNAFLDQLVAHGLLLRCNVPGIYGRGAAMVDIIERLEDALTVAGREPGAEVMRFPPVISRRDFERSEFLNSFPQLMGSVHTFAGAHPQHLELLREIELGQDWGYHQVLSDMVLTPAACYPVYPAVAGTLPPAGRLVDVDSYCFRHEPSHDPSRMQSFRMREFVRIADAGAVRHWRDQWIERGMKLLSTLGIEAAPAPAADPFFGPGSRLLAVNQREQELKFELVTHLNSDAKPIALISCNYHRDHFGALFGIRTSQGEIAHTACIGSGTERIALALLHTHGFDPATWPASVRGVLWR